MDPRDPTSAEPASIMALLLRWLSRQLAPEAMGWLAAELERQRMAVEERRLALSLGLAGRKVGRTDLTLDPDDELAAQRLRAGWQPRLWGTDEAARVALLIATYRGDDQPFAARIDRLCTTAEVTEHVAYLKGFAVFPAGRQLHDRAREGVRSSIGPVFEAVACHNHSPEMLLRSDRNRRDRWCSAGDAQRKFSSRKFSSRRVTGYRPPPIQAR